MCLHLSTFRMGDVASRHCSLFHAVDRFRELLSPNPSEPEQRLLQSLWDESFNALSDTAIFGILDREVFSGPTLGEPADAARFDFLTNTGEMFNRTKSFIVCDPDFRVRILFEADDSRPQSISRPFDEFIQAAESFVRWFDQLPDPPDEPYFPVDL